MIPSNGLHTYVVDTSYSYTHILYAFAIRSTMVLTVVSVGNFRMLGGTEVTDQTKHYSVYPQ